MIANTGLYPQLDCIADQITILGAGEFANGKRHHFGRVHIRVMSQAGQFKFLNFDLCIGKPAGVRIDKEEELQIWADANRELGFRRFDESAIYEDDAAFAEHR